MKGIEKSKDCECYPYACAYSMFSKALFTQCKRLCLPHQEVIRNHITNSIHNHTAFFFFGLNNAINVYSSTLALSFVLFFFLSLSEKNGNYYTVVLRIFLQLRLFLCRQCHISLAYNLLWSGFEYRRDQKRQNTLHILQISKCFSSS